MSSIVIAGDTSGSVTLQAPAVAGSTILNLPATSGTIQTSGAGYTANGVAYASSTSALTTGSALTFDGSSLVLGGTERINGTTTSALTIASSSGASNGFKLYNDSTNDLAYLMNFYNGSMVFGVNNTEQMRLTSTGLGIGTSSPARKLDVVDNGNINATSAISNSTAGTSSLARFLAVSDAGSAVFGMTSSSYTDITGAQDAMLLNANSASGGVAFALDGVLKMKLDSSGNLGLGGTASAVGAYRVLDLNHTTGGYLSLSAGGTRVGALYGASTVVGLEAIGASSPLQFVTNGSERARIDSSGNLLVGTTSTAQSSSNGVKVRNYGAVFVVNDGSTGGGDGFSYYQTSANAYRFYVASNGTISATNTSISAISDIRFKENVRDLDVGLAEVMTLKPRLYDWKEGKGANIKNARGFIAQEFEEVFPDLIDEWKDPAPEGEEPYKSVRQDLIPVLVKAIQEQQALINTLTERISVLENK